MEPPGMTRRQRMVLGLYVLQGRLLHAATDSYDLDHV